MPWNWLIPKRAKAMDTDDDDDDAMVPWSIYSVASDMDGGVKSVKPFLH